MVKRTSEEIRRDIFLALKNQKLYSYGALERKVNTNWNTIRKHIDTMKLFGAAEIIKGKVKITKFGLEVLKKL